MAERINNDIVSSKRISLFSFQRPSVNINPDMKLKRKSVATSCELNSARKPQNLFHSTRKLPSGLKSGSTSKRKPNSKINLPHLEKSESSDYFKIPPLSRPPLIGSFRLRRLSQTVDNLRSPLKIQNSNTSGTNAQNGKVDTNEKDTQNDAVKRLPLVSMNCSNIQKSRIALAFDDIEEEPSDEVTKPLPEIDLSRLDISSIAQPKENETTMNAIKVSPFYVEKSYKFGRAERRRSSIPRRVSCEKENVAPRGSDSVNPLNKEHPKLIRRSTVSSKMNTSEVDSKDSLMVRDDALSPPKNQVKQLERVKVHPRIRFCSIGTNTSPAPPPNSPASNKFLGSTKMERKIAESNEPLTKDASTNTDMSALLTHPSILGMKETIEKSISVQRKLLENIQFQYEEWLLEFQRAFEPISHLREQIQKLEIDDSSNDMNFNFEGEKDDSSSDGTLIYDRFLGPSISKKKSRLRRSTSHPSFFIEEEKESFNNSNEADGSFHSFHSDSSFFTTFVADCKRSSALPFMTPASRRNVSALKCSLNEQVKLLEG